MNRLICAPKLPCLLSLFAQRPHAEDGARFAPLVMRAHLALPHPCGVRPWLLPRHHNNEISFLFLFAFPFLLFFHAKIGFAKLSASTPPTVQCRSRSPSRQPAAGSRCKIKVQNVRSDAERVVGGENERPALWTLPADESGIALAESGRIRICG